MRRWLALSIVAHIAVVAALASHASTRPVVAAPPAVVAAIAPAPPELIEVQFLADAVAKPRAAPSPTPGIASRAIAAHPIATSSIPSPEPAANPVGEVAAGSEVARPAPPRIPSPAVAANSVEMVARPAALGMREQPAAPSTFSVRVEPDGTAHISDRRNVQIADGDQYAHDRAVAAAENWLEQHHERSNAVEMKVPSVGATVATFDMTDAAMRWAGQDPYAFEKLKVLDATREQRVQIGLRHREQQIIQTPALVRSNLDDIAKLPAAQREHTLAELWRDLEHSPAGEVARATITTYVHDHAIFSEAERALTSAP